MNQEDILKIATPLLKLLKYTGFPIYEAQGEINTNERQLVLRCSKRYLWFLLLLSSFLMYYLYNKGKDLKNVDDYIECFQFGTMLIRNNGILIESQLKKHEFVLVFNDLLKIQRFFEMKTKVSINFFSKLRRHFLIFVIFSYTTITLIALGDIIYLVQQSKIQNLDDDFSSSFLLSYYIGWFITIHSDFLIWFILKLLVNFYDRLIESVEKSEMSYKSALLCSILLQKISVRVNKSLEKVVLLKLSFDFVFFTTGLYYTIFVLIPENSTDILFDITSSLNNFIWLLTTAFYVIIILNLYQLIIEKVSFEFIF